MARQECRLTVVWLSWIGLPLLALVIGWQAGWLAGVIVLVAAIPIQVVYIRAFPRLSRVLGYGSVADAPAPAPPDRRHPRRVILYTASVCPFCPIVRGRLQRLQRDIEFELEEVDVTFRPQIIREKGLRTVPVLEADGRLLFGNATSAQLAAFLRGESPVRA